MIKPCERIAAGDIVKASIERRYLIPFFGSLVQAGFPSPAENYIERACDLNDLCINDAEATYFVRVASDSMLGDRIDRGDVLIVDCAKEVTDGRIAVVWLNGDHVVKRIHFMGQMVVLLSSNEKYDPIYVHKGDNFKVFGVVTFTILKQ